MHNLFVKMGLEDAARELFCRLDPGLDAKVVVEELPRGTSDASLPVTAEEGNLAFASAPAVQEGDRLRVILQLRRSAFDAYYALQRRKVGTGFETVTSLLDATVQEYLRLCPAAIQSDDGDRLIARLGREVEEILRSAAARLMLNPAMGNGYGEAQARRLFFDCNSVSYLRYERAESTGSLLLAPFGHPDVETLLRQRLPLRMAEHRAVRKLLELSSDEVCVLGDGYHVFGLARVAGTYDEQRQDLYSVRFVGQSHWELLHGEHLLMRVVDGQPALPDIHLESRFRRLLLGLFPRLHPRAHERLWQLVREASSVRRGALVVIAEAASAEAERLERGSTRVEPIPMSRELMRRVCGIDGAVLLDTSGRCHAIGLILDGSASSRGDPARGARYNSAVRYARSAPCPCLVAVVSEDGGTNLLAPDGA